jgi:uncharacterized alkaline shock family protein YloU
MSKAICHLHRAVVTVLLAAVAAGAAGTAYVLVSSRSSTGEYAGPSSLTTRLLAQWSVWLGTQVELHGATICAISIAVAMVALGLIALELRTVVRPLPKLVLSRGGLGEVAINLDQISRLAQREAEHVLGVREVETTARTLRGGINVKQKVSVEPEVAYSPLAEQVQLRVKKSLEHHLGFPVASVEVLLQHSSLRKSVI